MACRAPHDAGDHPFGAWGMSQRVEGLNLGADDYMAKPFHAAEVVARLHAITRRVPVSEERVLYTAWAGGHQSGGQSHCLTDRKSTLRRTNGRFWPA